MEGEKEVGGGGIVPTAGKPDEERGGGLEAGKQEKEEARKNVEEGEGQEDYDARTLCIVNIGTFTKPNQVERWVKETCKIERVERIKKIRQQRHAFVRMEKVEDVENAMKVMAATKFKGKIYVIEPAAPRNNRRKRKAQEEARDEAAKKAHLEDSREKETDEGKAADVAKKNVKDTITPLWRMTYEEQLARKVDRLRNLLRKLTKNVKKTFKDTVKSMGVETRRYHMSGWSKDQWFGEACAIEKEDIISSPVVQGYRNKSEFTVSFDDDGKPSVGFLLNSFPSVTVELPGEDVATCPWIARSACIAFKDRVLAKSSQQPYNKLNHSGFWRRLIVRHTVHKAVMVVVQVRANKSEAAVVEEAKSLVVDAFCGEKSWLSGPNGEVYTLTSLYMQENNTCSNAMDVSAPLHLLKGEKTVVETLGGVDLVVSPDSFLQVNTEAANKLYALVGKWANMSGTFNSSEEGGGNAKSGESGQKVVALDVCSGTGAIGLSLAKSGVVAGVSGVELIEAAVEDAKVNAAKNALTECTRYVAGRAELHMPAVIANARELGGSEARLVAVVDPPRAGLHPDVQKALRKEKAINKLIYVSCNADSFVNDASYLCRPLTKQELDDEGYPAPFVPVRAAAVDLFPYTEHCELVVLMERAPTKELSEHPGADKEDKKEEK
mmetsp:Transcript_11214/g.29569  ORF Transcript_11214/g.29569 Transcript_11214/m.29569 type:complete len:664 (-) Transcript_11214:1587-3578(-)